MSKRRFLDGAPPIVKDELFRGFPNTGTSEDATSICGKRPQIWSTGELHRLRREGERSSAVQTAITVG